MSLITVILHEPHRTYRLRLHYRIALHVLISICDRTLSPGQLEPYHWSRNPIAPYDSGILVICPKSREILSLQHCFTYTHIHHAVPPDWQFVDYLSPGQGRRAIETFQKELLLRGIIPEGPRLWEKFIKRSSGA
jgi:hypothetical protein